MAKTNGWQKWALGVLFAVALGLASVVWAMQREDTTDKVGKAEYTEFKDSIVHRLDRIEDKLDEALRHPR